MRDACSPTEEVRFRPTGPNFLTVQASCLGDWERVMHYGPWNFRGDAVIIAPYDGISKPSTVKLETIDTWIQIHDVPNLYAHLVTPLAAKVGEVLYVEQQPKTLQEIFSVYGCALKLINHCRTRCP